MVFHDIFSKKKIKEKPLQKIIVDHREKNSLVIAELISKSMEIDFQQLQIGDYIIGETVVERKTLPDFISSMINKRMFSQLENLKQYDRSLLILEGYQDLDLSKTKLSENALRGLILSISLDYKIPVILTKNPEDTASFLYLMAKKKKSEISLRAKIQMTDNQRLRFIIEGFPSIGPIAAKKLLLKYKTIHSLINAPEEEIRSLLGKKSDKFLELLKKQYQEE